MAVLHKNGESVLRTKIEFNGHLHVPDGTEWLLDLRTNGVLLYRRAYGISAGTWRVLARLKKAEPDAAKRIAYVICLNQDDVCKLAYARS